MKYSNVYIDAMGYELAPVVVKTKEIEERLEPVYSRLGMKVGQLEALTGIRERRYWPVEHSMQEETAKAAKKALANAPVRPDEVEMLVYCGVCRDNMEPATACAIADSVGVPASAQIYDISNACLGALTGITQVANAIELGQIEAGLVVSCESSRQIVDATIDRMNANPDMATFKTSMATMTGGSGAVAILLTSARRSSRGHRLLGGVVKNNVDHHKLCIWGPRGTGIPVESVNTMYTDAANVLVHGVALGKETYGTFKEKFNLNGNSLDKVICHQVGSAHRQTILDSINIPLDRDFVTYPFLGNIGSVSLPITAAIAHERGFLEKDDLVGFFGIGSGLSCMMMCVKW